MTTTDIDPTDLSDLSDAERSQVNEALGRDAAEFPYLYLISYICPVGPIYGHAIVPVRLPLNTGRRVQEIAAYVAEQAGREAVILNLQLIDGPGAPAPTLRRWQH